MPVRARLWQVCERSRSNGAGMRGGGFDGGGRLFSTVNRARGSESPQRGVMQRHDLRPFSRTFFLQCFPLLAVEEQCADWASCFFREAAKSLVLLRLNEIPTQDGEVTIIVNRAAVL